MFLVERTYYLAVYEYNAFALSSSENYAVSAAALVQRKLCEKPEVNGGVMRNKIEMLEEILAKMKLILNGF